MADTRTTTVSVTDLNRILSERDVRLERIDTLDPERGERKVPIVMVFSYVDSTGKKRRLSLIPPGASVKSDFDASIIMNVADWGREEGARDMGDFLG